ncbi:endo alpha-1,4 polygalactosaminidase [Nitrosophilus alvini]|uniref:endo alpha-1,4 polygalactosaminidase n=1 Tax=Nitrosophilus alvini TaxID=2714855 RepID=UPI00190E4098|nr:endo alpha-1,4 polygalactosaminidase [Nitrosophilus alvini]
MKRLCCSKLFIAFFLLAAYALAAQRAVPSSVALYYDQNPPREIFRLFDWIVVDPDATAIKKNRKEAVIFAYVSIGEVEKERKYFSKIKKEWIIGQNRDWKSFITDIRKKEYRDFLIETVLKKLNDYDGFMFDTLDSYQLVLKDKKERKEYEKALEIFIKDVKTKFPEKKIIVNRGFEILENIKEEIDAVLAESLFSGIDTKNMQVKKIGAEDTKWLKKRLDRVKKLGLPVIVVDYVEPKNRKEAKEIAKKIENNGFIPYVTDKHLSTVGISTIEPIPRKVLILFYGSEKEKWKYDAHLLFSMPLEYLGFIPELWNIKEKGLPDTFLADRYAGVIVALEGTVPENQDEFFNWILQKKKEGIKILFLNDFGFSDNSYLKKLNIKVSKNLSTPFEKYRILHKDKIANFETEPLIEHTYYLLYPQKGEVLIEAENSKGQKFATAAITPWGGYALQGSCTVELFGDTLWVLNPFQFFKRALRLPDIPTPDTTTENGSRIMFVHIDGDGFMERAVWDQKKFASQILYEEILKKYKIPHSVSVIEGEIAPYGLYPEISPKLEKIARKIFSLPNVEAASHSFSHPFIWEFAQAEKDGYTLSLKNYRFNLKREILGSIDYINRQLLKNKKTRLFFWTGDCLPNKEALKICYENQILNINGGDTIITDEHPWLIYISPLGLYRGEFFQIYAPIQNENIFTDGWTNYAGFKKVLQTFRLTGYPRRIKPINIYYHFYSASKQSSLKSLKEIYLWAMNQKTIPIYTSEWIKKVLDFENIAIAIKKDKWIIKGDGHLKTLRLEGFKNIDFAASKNIVGEKYDIGSTYVHLNDSGDYELKLGKEENAFSYIIEANSLLKDFKRNKRGFKAVFKGYIPIKVKIRKREECSYKVIGPKDYRVSEKENMIIFEFEKSKEATIETECR